MGLCDGSKVGWDSLQDIMNDFIMPVLSNEVCLKELIDLSFRNYASNELDLFAGRRYLFNLELRKCE